MPRFSESQQLKFMQAAFMLCGVVNAVMSQIVEPQELEYLNRKAEGYPTSENNFHSPFDSKDYTKRDEYLDVVSSEYGTIAAALHRISYKSWLYKLKADCFGFKEFSQVAKYAIRPAFYNTSMDYSTPVCSTWLTYGDVIMYYGEAYGLTQLDCLDFTVQYLLQADYCTYEMDLILVPVLIVFASLLICFAMYCACRRPIHESGESREPLRLRGMINPPSFMRDLLKMNRYSPELHVFLQEVNDLLDKLTGQQIEALEEKLPQIKCGISLGLPIQPVKINETLYDLDELLKLPVRNGIRRIPHMQDVGFMLNELTPARAEWNQIKAAIDELYPNLRPKVTESTALIA